MLSTSEIIYLLGLGSGVLLGLMLGALITTGISQWQSGRKDKKA